MRAYVDLPLDIGQCIDLPDNAAAHLLRVLRLQAGDACVLFNGDGHDYTARFLRADKRGGSVEVLGRAVINHESSLRIILMQGIARGEKMDWILQKATELGVAGILPVASDRTEVKLDARRADKRHAHWRGVVIAACEQCGRVQLPQVHAPAPLADALAALSTGTMRLVLDPQAQSGVAALHPPRDNTVVIAIGPEGGFSSKDRTLLAHYGFDGLRLGPRILRSETAGVAAITALQARFGDLA